MQTMNTNEDLSSERIRAEIAKLMAETAKLNAEAAKMSRERWWYPVVVAATIIGASLAFAKLVLA